MLHQLVFTGRCVGAGREGRRHPGAGIAEHRVHAAAALRSSARGGGQPGPGALRLSVTYWAAPEVRRPKRQFQLLKC